MTAEQKEKAKELVDRFTFSCRECDFEQNAKQCALIAVDEILLEHFGDTSDYGTRRYYYFQEVKQEIEKL